MKAGILIPVYNHGKMALNLRAELSVLGYPVILVDDGNSGAEKALLEEAAKIPETALVVNKKNMGKGGAFAAGLEKAHELGLSHVLQIDADGQHDRERIGFFMEEAARHPEACICSWPQYDDTVPPIRREARKMANTWTRIAALDRNIVDAMCGFRVYPVEPVRDIFHRCGIDRRMGFDTDILIRISWRGIPLFFYPVKVTYPRDGVSNYRNVRDNVRMTWVLFRSFFGMLIRLPILLSRTARKGR